MPRPSAAQVWAAGGCTGSPAWAQRYGRASGPAAAEGTRVHGLAATCLGALNDAALSGEAAEVREGVAVYLDYVVRLAAADVSNLYVEQALSVPIGDHEERGTADAVYLDYATRTAHVADLKWGMGIVEAADNWQLATYALCVSHTVGPGWRYVLHIVQPRAYHPEGPCRRWSPTAAELDAMWSTIRAKFAEAMGPTATLRTGEHCRYCDALHACPAARSLTLHAIEAADREPVELPPDQLARELQTLREGHKLIGYRALALEEQIWAHKKAGTAVPFTAVSRGGGSYTWDNEAAAAVALEMLTGKKWTHEKLRTPTQLIAAGVPESLAAMLATRKPGKAKLVVDLQNSALRKMFGNVASNP